MLAISMAGKSKKEKGNEAVRQFRIREKAKEVADKEKAERLRKENLELESKVASHQQVKNSPFSCFWLLDQPRWFPCCLKNHVTQSIDSLT